jgi:Lrp/AsnC family transcriptional regulator, regulator for asnA, asnC and gidA
LSSAEIDDLDRKLLQLLQIDAKLSCAEISRKLSVPEATVRFRVKRLMERGVIRNFSALLDPTKVGFNVSGAILFKIDSSHLEEASNRLASFSETRYLFQSTGEYDLVAVVFTHDMAHLTRVVKDAKKSLVKGSTVIGHYTTFKI